MLKPTKESYELLHRGALCLARVEAAGMRIDTDYLNSAIARVKAEIKETEARITKDPVYKTWKRHFGAKTKMGSRDQLGHTLKVMGYKFSRQTEKGNTKYGSAELLAVASDLPVVNDFLKVENLKTKVLGTYLYGIRRELTPDGYVHPFCNLHTTVTYRSSLDSPPLQTIPVRQPEMRKLIRPCFIARDGYHLVEIDFSGIEVRVAACYNHDPVLIRYIEDPSTDMHRDMAAELFFMTEDFLNEEKEWAKKTVRDWTKNRFVFPQFYGSVWFQCAPHLWEGVSQLKTPVPGTGGLTITQYLKKKGIKTDCKCQLTYYGDKVIHENPRPGTFCKHVQDVEAGFWNERFRVYTDWKRKWWKAYLKKGEYQTLTGFVIRFGTSGILSRNDCSNYGNQGSASHCKLWSMVELDDWLRKNKMKTRIVNEVHDSILFDAHPSELQDLLHKAKEVMTEDLPNHWDWIIVPLAVEAEVSPIGGSWLNKEEWIEKKGNWVKKG